MDKIERIVQDVTGRYYAGLPLRDAVQHACNGRRLSADEMAAIESRAHEIVASVEDPSGALVVRMREAVESVSRTDLLAFTDCAANTGYIDTLSAAVLAAIAASDLLWHAFDRLTARPDFTIPMYTTDQSARQQRIALAIREVRLHARLAAFTRMQQGPMSTWAALAVAAGARSAPVNDALRHVRNVYALLGGGL